MKPSYYIASRLENAPRVRALKILLDAKGWHHTYDWTVHGSVQQCDHATIQAVADAEADGVDAADVVIVLLPGGRGTHAELGMAIAGKKAIYMVSENPEVDFGRDGRTCAFYHHSRVEQLASWEALVARLGVA
jgi:nucleoside 2-deoxyribosyltransferase